MKQIPRAYSGIWVLLAIALILVVYAYVSSDRTSPLLLQYHYTTETVYFDVKIEQTKICFTHIDEKKIKERCAQWIKQTPCWTQADLITEEAQLSEKEINELKHLISRSHIMELDSYYGASQDERCYTYTLRINDKQILYCSRPGRTTPPEAFTLVTGKISEIVKTHFLNAN